MLFLYHSNITVVCLAFSGSVGVSCAAAIQKRLSKHCKNNYICLQEDRKKKKVWVSDRGGCKFVPNEQFNQMSPVRYSQKEQLFLTWTDSQK